MVNILGINLSLLKLDYLRKFFYLVPKVPRQVNIEATNKCNLNCKMCKRRELKIPETGIELDRFKQVVDKLPRRVKEISFGSYGESFIHPDIYEMIKYVKSKSFFLSITTNGFLFIKEENRKKVLESGVDVLRFSVEEIKPSTSNAHPYNINLLAALEKLADEKKQTGSQTKLFFNTVVNQGNYDQIIDLIKHAETIGFDAVELIHLDKKANDVKEYLPIEKEIALYRKINQMKDQMKFNIQVTSLYDRYIGIRKFAFRNMKYCPFTYDVCHVTIEGDVTPCCFGLPRHRIGNIFEHSLSEIWNSSQFKKFRKEQQQVCKGCTLMKLE
ncbi:MAG TPA: radical SAM protein [Candidatus Nanoarchaeia archaeon]|nr:radical SAM protein [Candidatus Nanoarchaeia archaeon]